MKPGIYEIIVTPYNTQTQYSVNAIVDLVDFVSITGYTIEHATTDTSYDGKVIADYSSPFEEEFNFLWTNGSITHNNSLNNIRPGYYTACPISKSGNTVRFIHLVPPAHVRTQRSKK